MHLTGGGGETPGFAAGKKILKVTDIHGTILRRTAWTAVNPIHCRQQEQSTGKTACQPGMNDARDKFRAGGLERLSTRSIMLVHTPSAPAGLPGTAPFAGCEQLFASYPLAVTAHSADAGRSMVLLTRAAGQAGFFVLIETGHGLFVIRSWNCEQEQEVVPGKPVPDVFAWAIADGMPVPRDRAVLGWVADRQVTALMAVHSEYSPAVNAAPPAPEIQVMPMAGTVALDWPPFTTSPLACGRFWDYLDRGRVVDMVPLLTGHAGHAFWAPCAEGNGPGRGAGCVVITANLAAEEYWLPAGVYTDHWLLREGMPTPVPAQLLALPGTVDLASEPGMAAGPAS
jgi:hypothetical protein